MLVLRLLVVVVIAHQVDIQYIHLLVMEHLELMYYHSQLINHASN
jgi:hypothetical protein